jgi:uncharacterized protein YodC (DUF2158 family)
MRLGHERDKTPAMNGFTDATLKATKNYKTGSLVRLKSGGPAMTVRSVTGAQIRCQWFTEDSLAQEYTFHEDTLETIVPIIGNGFVGVKK